MINRDKIQEKYDNLVLNCNIAWIPAFAEVTAPFSSAIVIPAKAGIQAKFK
ncbi:MAG TPA: hypothetical protein VLL98_03530 [Rickettsiales bacterium]|nr:hypothetical protein [Rickettsiales bacterium]